MTRQSFIPEPAVTFSREVFTRVLELVRQAPAEQVAMGHWANHPGHITCETAACIGGWVVAQAYERHDKTLPIAKPPTRGADRFMRELQAISRCDSNTFRHLFYMHGITIETLFETFIHVELTVKNAKHNFLMSNPTDFVDALPPPIRKKAVINVLATLLDSNKVDWIGSIKRAVSDYLSPDMSASNTINSMQQPEKFTG